MRKVILYIAASLDGYIAAPGDDLSFLGAVAKEGEDYGYQAFTEIVDTVIMGRKTYDWVLQHADFPHSNKTAYIITRTPRPSVGNTHFYTGNLPELIARLKSESGQHIFCDGGAEVVTALLNDNLIDEFYLSVIPVLLGTGTRLFKDGRPTLPLELVAARSYETGLVQLHYRKISL